MDPVTHALAGALIPKIGFKRKASLWVSIISSIAPDFDYITRFWGADTFLRYHRGITHGIIALFIFPIITGIILKYNFKKGFLYYSFLSFIAYGLHLFMDLTNQYGVRIFSPLDWNLYSLDITFIIDPYITIGLVMSLTACYFNKKRRITISFLTFILFAFYINGKYYLKNVSEEFLRENMDEYVYRLCPLPNDFFRWWFVSKTGNILKVGFVDLFTKRVYIQDRLRYSETEPEILLSKSTKTVKNFLYFAQFPYSEIKRQGNETTVVWRELSYAFLPGDHFVAKVIYNRNGKVIQSYFKF